MEKRQFFQQRVRGYLLKKKKSRHRPYTLSQNELKMITDINAKHKTIKLLEYNTGENADDLEYSADF